MNKTQNISSRSSLHLEAHPEAIAKTVLICGDPLRAAFFAKKMLAEVFCYNEVRGMLGFTGYYQGKRVSIQGTGMGMGSTGIYVHEMIQSYQVKKIIRIGTLGAIQPDLNIGQVILAMSAGGDSSTNAHLFQGMNYAATADWNLLKEAFEAGIRLRIPTIQGPIFSTDTFYGTTQQRWDIWQQHWILGVEMESQILYTLARRHQVQALSILTVSDNILTGTTSDARTRERDFEDMVKIALEIA